MKQILELLQSETIEVVGCTEPASIAYSFSIIKKFCPDINIQPRHIKAKLSATRDVLRNADTAGLPHLKINRLQPVVAIGIFSEHPQYNIFSNITKKQIVNVNKLLKQKDWLKIIPLNKKNFYIKSELVMEGNTYESIIRDKHNNLVSFKINGNSVYKSNSGNQIILKNLDEIFTIARTRDKSIEEFAKHILLTNGRLYDNLKINDVYESIAQLIEYRMKGKHLSICTFTGSGNQGLFLSIPFYKLYNEQGDKVLPAFVFTLLTQIYLMQQKGRLSKFCGLSEKSSAALFAGLLFLNKKNINEIQKKIDYICEITSGLLCEGAKISCADKAYMCLKNIYRQLDKV